MSKSPEKVIHISHLARLSPEEQQPYFAVPGWRMWKCVSPFSLKFTHEYARAQEEVASKPYALYVSSLADSEKFEYIARRFEEVTGVNVRPLYASGTRDGSSVSLLLLEPLTDDEVRTIDRLGEVPGPLGSIDRPEGILRPEELKRILKAPRIFPPATL
ncbi:MAG: hypothetical protein NUV73_03835 [Candidatus Daviesbacteria bacterium]|nr:hypothetical protein [Candidatus Daviesbacteria bacterium]